MIFGWMPVLPAKSQIVYNAAVNVDLALATIRLTRKRQVTASSKTTTENRKALEQ
jgi:hypothetical protein